MAEGRKREGFQVAPGDPLADAHAAVSAWVEEVTIGPNVFSEDYGLKSRPSGRALLESKPERSRWLVLAAIDQLQRWFRVLEAIRSGLDGPGLDAPPDGNMLGRQRQAETALNALMRR